MDDNIIAYLDEIKSLFPSLINSFVYYYGEEYKDRIIEVLNSTTFIVRDEFYNFVGSNNESRMNKIEVIKNQNPKFKASIESSDSCVVHKEQPPVIIIPYMNPIKIHILIHEINHTLHSKLVEDESYSLISIGPKKMKCVEGIPTTSNEQVFYEILNEYMTYDILRHYKNNNQDNPNLSFDFNYANYLFLDDYLGYSFSELYSIWRDEIAVLLINANGDKLKELFGSDDYDKAEEKCTSIFNDINDKAIEVALNGDGSLSELEIKQSLKRFYQNDSTMNQDMSEISKVIEMIKKRVPKF